MSKKSTEQDRIDELKQRVNETPFERFEKVASTVVNVPKEKVDEAEKKRVKRTRKRRSD